MSTKLSTYNEKRNFERTAEPEGVLDDARATTHATAQQPLRFAVQHHVASRDHYDLRLEWDGVLLSWAIPKGPSYNPHEKRLAVHVEDHPLDYRTFEGIIPQGEYGGGTVQLWDEGTWEPLGDVDADLARGELKFQLHGHRLKGAWVLVHLKPRPGEKGDDWLLIKERDDEAQDTTGIAAFTTSVSTGRTLDEIAQGADARFDENPFGPDDIHVELAKLVDEPPAGDEWLYEVKYDGYRMLAFIEGGAAQLITRNGHDYTDHFPALASALAELAGTRALVLDGEVVVADAQGRTDFQALQNFLRSPAGKHPAFMVFDLLAEDGDDLRELPLHKRKDELKRLLADAPDAIRFSPHVQGEGAESFQAACKLGLEGVVGKRATSAYRGTRNGDWIKLKCDNRQEFVVGGYTRSAKKEPDGVSSLLLGSYEAGALVYVGRVGSGIGGAEARELKQAFDGLAQNTSPFANPPRARSGEQLFWLRPQLVVEVKFAEWTEDEQLRHPSYQGLRADKDPQTVRREVVRHQDTPDEKKAIEPVNDTSAIEKNPSERTSYANGSVTIDGVTITHPEKVLFTNPDVTKEEVVRYYARMAKRILPYAADRILSIVRCPRGTSSSCFFKKHPGPHPKGVTPIQISTTSGEEEYFYIDNPEGLVYEAQMGTLEFHLWGSRIETLEQPDFMTFDLDPDEGLNLEQVRQGVRDLNSVLDGLGLTTFLKTSGGKGYHVVVPFRPEASWETFHDFARRIAEVMEHQWPDRYTSNIRKAKRVGRIFIDWQRNGRGATSIAPYSLRARDRATVSMPLAWDELDKVAPDAIDLAGALARLEAPDPWENFFKVDQALK